MLEIRIETEIDEEKGKGEQNNRDNKFPFGSKLLTIFDRQLKDADEEEQTDDDDDQVEDALRDFNPSESHWESMYFLRWTW